MNASTLEKIDRFLFHNEISAFKSLLTADPSLLTSRDPQTGKSILSIAVFYGDEKIVSWLIQQGVDLLAQNKHGTTALHLAFKIRNGALSALLYHYETRILGELISEKTMQLYREFLEGRPDGWRHEERDIFLARSAALSKDKPALPSKTTALTLENLGRLHSESKESDRSGSGPSEVLLSEGDRESVSGADLRHRAVFKDAAAKSDTVSDSSVDSK